MNKEPHYWCFEIWVCSDCGEERGKPHAKACPAYAKPRRKPRAHSPEKKK